MSSKLIYAVAAKLHLDFNEAIAFAFHEFARRHHVTCNANTDSSHVLFAVKSETAFVAVTEYHVQSVLLRALAIEGDVDGDGQHEAAVDVQRAFCDSLLARVVESIVREAPVPLCPQCRVDLHRLVVLRPTQPRSIPVNFGTDHQPRNVPVLAASIGQRR
jgi:hypothetical protein